MSKNPRLIDLSGQSFNRWTVIRKAGNTVKGTPFWLCRCDCGTERPVISADLRNGKSKSCGCIKDGSATRTHGESKSRLYNTWKNIRARCADKSNPVYGGKGLTVCLEWHTYTTFRAWALANGYADNLSIERLNNDVGYNPDNCVWADPKTQARNRSIVLMTSDGRPWAEVAEQHGVPVSVMHSRMSAGGWPIEVAATWPVGKPRAAMRKRNNKGQWTGSSVHLWRR